MAILSLRVSGMDELLRFARCDQEDGIVALKIDSYGENVFPAVEEVDAKPIEDGGYEVILFTRIEGQLKPVIIRILPWSLQTPDVWRRRVGQDLHERWASKVMLW